MSTALAGPTTASTRAAAVRVEAVVGLDLGLVDRREADYLLRAQAAHLLALGAGGAATLMTHRAVTDSGVHVAVSLELALDPDAAWELVHDGPLVAGGVPAGLWTAGRSAGPDDLMQGARSAAAAASARTGGRAVHFPGIEALVGELSVEQILRSSAIERVSVLAVGTAKPQQVVATRDHVRPTCIDGQLVLQVQPAAGRTLVPFEVARPTPCCAEH